MKLDKVKLELYKIDKECQQIAQHTQEIILSQIELLLNYLSDLLRIQTGQNTQQHIHNKLISKEKLSTTELSVSEIAYELGFEHSQSFSTLFKKKTELSPLEFRKSLN